MAELWLEKCGAVMRWDSDALSVCVVWVGGAVLVSTSINMHKRPDGEKA